MWSSCRRTPVLAYCRQTHHVACAGCRTSGTTPTLVGYAEAVVGPQIHLLIFAAPPEPFCKHDVQPAACAAHTDLNTMVFQEPRELQARGGYCARKFSFWTISDSGKLMSELALSITNTRAGEMVCCLRSCKHLARSAPLVQLITVIATLFIHANFQRLNISST